MAPGKGRVVFVLVQVSAEGVAQTQPADGVHEPAQQHQLAAVQHAGNGCAALSRLHGVLEQHPPTGPSEQEGGVVDSKRRDQQPWVRAADLLPSDFQVDIEAGYEE